MSISKFCGNCGAPRKEGAMFCKECGKPIPQTQSNMTPPEGNQEIIPSTQIESTPVPVNVDTTIIESPPVDLTVTETEITATAENSNLTDAPPLIVSSTLQGRLSGLLAKMINQRNKKPLLYGGALIVIVLIAVIIGSIFGSSSSSSTPLVYLKDYELMLKINKYDEPGILTKNWVDTEAAEDDLSAVGSTSTQDSPFYQFGTHFQNYIKVNESGDRMFYLGKINGDDSTANLYYSDPIQVVKAGAESTDQGVRIASNLSLGESSAFQITNSGEYVLYLKNYDSESGGSLYLYHSDEEVLIDKNVKANYSFSEDESGIIYMKTPDDETYDLYTKSVNSKHGKVKIDSDIDDIINYSSDLNTIYYTKSNESDSEDPSPYSLYVKENGNDKQKLISDYSVLESIGTTDQFFFTRTTHGTTKLIDLVTDNMAAEDLKITEPSYSDFQYQESYTDYWGDISTRTETDYDRYYIANDLYRDKLNRDSLRSDLKNEELSTTTKQLFLYADGKETEVSGEFGRSIYADATSKSIIFIKEIKDQIEKIKLSDISDTSEVKDLYDNSITESTINYIVLNGGAEQEMPEDTNDSQSFSFSEDHKKLYAAEEDMDKSIRTLVVWDVLEGKLSNRVIIDENVGQYMIVHDEIWYYRDVKNNQGELLTYTNGEKVTIASAAQVGNTTFYPKDEVVLYMTDFNNKRLSGSLFMQRGDKNVKIKDDVNFYNYNNASDIFYISDYRLKSGQGDLWEYHGKKDTKLIDSGVQSMLPLKRGYTF